MYFAGRWYLSLCAALCAATPACVFFKSSTLELSGLDNAALSSCLSDEDCPSDLGCVAGFCRKIARCTTASQCEPGETCNAEGYCIYLIQARGEGEACVDADECQLGYGCNDGVCRVLPCSGSSCPCADAGTCPMGLCIPAADAALCAQSGWGCGTGTLSDNCGASRQITCGGCPDDRVCGGVKPNQCGCDEGDAALCERLGYECGASMLLIDLCGDTREVASCGSHGGGCQEDHRCDLASHECRCKETDEEACARLGYDCGADLLILDRCGQPRTVTCGGSMGGCPAYQTCGLTSPNKCACNESDADMCLRYRVVCGPFSSTDYCNLPRTVECGGCMAGSMCSENLCSPLAPASNFGSGMSGGLYSGDAPEISTGMNTANMQDVPSTMSSDGKTIIVAHGTVAGVCGVQVYRVVDRESFTAAATVVRDSPGDLPIGESVITILPNRRTVIAIHTADYRSLDVYERASTSDDTFGAISSPTVATINAWVPSLTVDPDTTQWQIDTPVISHDGLMLFFTVRPPAASIYTHRGAAPEGFYVAKRSSIGGNFGTPTRMADSDTLSAGGWFITAVSSDHLTILMLGTQPAEVWRTKVFTRQSIYGSFVQQPDWLGLFRTRMTADGTRLVGNYFQGGCAAEQIAEVPPIPP